MACLAAPPREFSLATLLFSANNLGVAAFLLTHSEVIYLLF